MSVSSLNDRAGSSQTVALAAVLPLMMGVGYRDRGAFQSALTLGLGAIAQTLGVFFWLGAERRIMRLSSGRAGTFAVPDQTPSDGKPDLAGLAAAFSILFSQAGVDVHSRCRARLPSPSPGCRS